MLEILKSNKFNKDFKRIQKRNWNIESLKTVIEILASGNSLPDEYKDHSLIGKLSEYRDCHIEPDWLLIYKIEDNFLVLYRTGSHSDIF